MVSQLSNLPSTLHDCHTIRSKFWMTSQLLKLKIAARIAARLKHFALLNRTFKCSLKCTVPNFQMLLLVYTSQFNLTNSTTESTDDSLHKSTKSRDPGNCLQALNGIHKGLPTVQTTLASMTPKLPNMGQLNMPTQRPSQPTQTRVTMP